MTEEFEKKKPELLKARWMKQMNRFGPHGRPGTGRDSPWFEK